MENIIKKRVIKALIVVISIIAITITVMIIGKSSLVSVKETSTGNVSNDQLSTLATVNNEEVNSSAVTVEEITPYSFGEKEWKFIFMGAEIRVYLDARDSGFGDDILITYEVLNGRQVEFEIKVWFNAKTGSVNEGWSHTGFGNKKVMNSGKTSVQNIVCEWSITCSGTTTQKYNHIFYIE